MIDTSIPRLPARSGRTAPANSDHLPARLERALEHDGLDIVLQPIVAPDTLAVVAAEALARWRDPDYGDVRPDVFIPVAEEAGLIGAVGACVLRQAAAQAARWAAELPAGERLPTLCVNVSGRQLVDPSFPATVLETLDETGVPAEKLVLELTETALAEEAAAVRAIERLRAHGIGVVVDDLGTGYSTLASLCALPVDGVKIDRRFIQALDTRQGRAIVEAVLGIGRSLDLRVVAEGVETEHQLSFLRELGCPLVQGFLVGRPMTPEQFADTLPAARPTA